MTHTPRRLVRVLLAGAILAALANAWLIEGLIVPIVVTSGSMAPWLLGPHRQWRCTNCQREFACDLESLPADRMPAVCPECGAQHDPLQGGDLQGDRVLVDRSAFLWRLPRRWEVVVFRCPEEPGTLCVKRVVGLPGESVQIQNGDVLIDGQVAKKNLAESRALAVPVHHASPRDSRWQSDVTGTWHRDGEKLIHPDRATASDTAMSPDLANSGVAGDNIDWLTYHHCRCVTPGAAPTAGEIVDESPYDQNESRQLSPVADLYLRCEVQASGTGLVYWRDSSKADQFVISLNIVSGDGELLHNGRPAARFAVSAEKLQKPARVELVLADCRVQWALDERVLLEYDYVPQAGSQPPTAEPLAIGAEGPRVEIRGLQVLRDVYYTPGPAGAPAQYRLGPDEYFLLGDNSPHAVDSRFWSPRQTLSGRLLLGRALRW